jgi:DNA-directed RNA polymerase specialized sigma subunit
MTETDTLALAAETQQRYKEAMEAQRQARAAFDDALARAFASPISLQQIADTLGISRHRVWQLKARINQQRKQAA